MTARRRAHIALHGLVVGALAGAVAGWWFDAGHTWLRIVLGGAVAGWLLGGAGALAWSAGRALHAYWSAP